MRKVTVDLSGCAMGIFIFSAMATLSLIISLIVRALIGG